MERTCSNCKYCKMGAAFGICHEGPRFFILDEWNDPQWLCEKWLLREAT